ncbi:MAG: hypothetical protein QM776_17835 [Rhodocyclaceae bacterium]
MTGTPAFTRQPLRIGVVGFSQPEFDHDLARSLLEAAICKAIAQFGHDGLASEIEVVSGLTSMGVPLIAYQLARARGFRTVGISAKQALRVKAGVFAVDACLIEGEAFGDESSLFVSYIDCLIRVGGGPQSHKEVSMFRQRCTEERWQVQQRLIEHDVAFLG